MANKKSSKKDLRRIAKRRVQNQQTKTSLKTFVKKVRTAAAASDVNAAQETLQQAIRALDKAAQRGIIHKNQAARRKSRVAKAAAKLGPAVAVAVKVRPKAVVEKAPVAEKAVKVSTPKTPKTPKTAKAASSKAAVAKGADKAPDVKAPASKKAPKN